MKEAEWEACEDADAMLAYIERRQRHRPSRRKLCLYACACCRCFWHLFAHPCCRTAIEQAEGFVDGLVSQAELMQTMGRVRAIPPLSEERYSPAAVHWAVGIVLDMARRYPEANAREAAHYARLALFSDKDVRRRQSRLLHDILGNPFRPVPVKPAWLAWNDGTVPKLAQAICDERAFDRLPILADALEEAGCADVEILGHLRSAGPHALGCWALDLLLGKG